MGKGPEVSQVAAEAGQNTAGDLQRVSTKPAPRDAVRKASQVSRMFARIVPTYDLMNRLMSVGRDQAWRQLATCLAAPPPDGAALDVATGTGDLAIALAQRTQYVVGVDVCQPMLGPATKKVAQARSQGQVRFMLADALALPGKIAGQALPIDARDPFDLERGTLGQRCRCIDGQFRPPFLS